MDFSLQWLLLGLPLTFALGWLASRFDLRQWRRDLQASMNASIALSCCSFSSRFRPL